MQIMKIQNVSLRSFIVTTKQGSLNFHYSEISKDQKSEQEIMKGPKYTSKETSSISGSMHPKYQDKINFVITLTS